MIQAYNKLGYRAYNVASHDFAGGPDNVRQLANMAEFPFISVNLLDSATNKPMFKPYIIEKMGGKKFGVLGVTSTGKAPIKGVRVDDIINSVRRYLPEIRNQADYIILLACLNREDEIPLFKETLDIDFVLVSGSFRYSRNLENKNGTLVARCGNIGKYVGIVKFDIHKPDEDLTDISNLMVQMKYAGKRMDTFKSATGDKSPEEFYANEPNILRTIKSLETQIQVLESEIRTAVNPVTFDLVDLDESVPDDTEIRSMLNDLGRRISRLQP